VFCFRYQVRKGEEDKRPICWAPGLKLAQPGAQQIDFFPLPPPSPTFDDESRTQVLKRCNFIVLDDGQSQKAIFTQFRTLTA
jgi:hypothetical protein